MARASGRIAVDMHALQEAFEEVEALLQTRAVPRDLLGEWKKLIDADELVEVEYVGRRWHAIPHARVTTYIGNLRVCAVSAPRRRSADRSARG